MTTEVVGACEHKHGAVFGCKACAARVRAKYPEFPLQVTRDVKVKPGPLSVPWPVAEKAWAAYAQQYGTGQSVERLAERGGFGWCEMDMFHPGWREEVDPFRQLVAELAALRAVRVAVEPTRRLTELLLASEHGPYATKTERALVDACARADALRASRSVAPPSFTSKEAREAMAELTTMDDKDRFAVELVLAMLETSRWPTPRRTPAG